MHKSIISLLFKTEKTLTDMKFFFITAFLLFIIALFFLESNKKENPEKVFFPLPLLNLGKLVFVPVLKENQCYK